MDKSNIFNICIGRQTGSGGKEVAKILGRILNVPVYDKELIYIASKESGLSPEFFEKADERSSKGFMGSVFALGNNYLNNDKLFEIQSRVILSLAEKGSSIFIGRCADYILRDRENVLSIFISAEDEYRAKRVADSENMTLQEAQSFIKSNDKRREEYYNYYTFKKWGAAGSYDLCLNSSSLGIDKIIKYILNAVS